MFISYFSHILNHFSISGKDPIKRKIRSFKYVANAMKVRVEENQVVAKQHKIHNGKKRLLPQSFKHLF